MISSLLLVLASVNQNGLTDLRKSNIINGKVVENPRMFPYQVSIEGATGHKCGGSIINPMIILTAGHCASALYAWESKVRAGSLKREKGGQIVNVKHFIIHPNFNSITLDYDAAIIKLQSPIELNGVTTKSIELQEFGIDVPIGAKAVVAGWGNLEEDGELSDVLMYTSLVIRGDEDCTKLRDYTSRMLCAGYLDGRTDTCKADSGGPLVVRGVQVGIVSWGEGCANLGKPGVYTAISKIRKWIDLCIEKLK